MLEVDSTLMLPFWKIPGVSFAHFQLGCFNWEAFFLTDA